MPDMFVTMRNAFKSISCIILAGLFTSAVHGAPDAPVKPAPAVTKDIAVLIDKPGEFGKTYTLVSDDARVNFSLKTAEYTVTRVNLGQRYNEFPTAKEKLLVLHFTLQNPNDENLDITPQTVQFDALDQSKAIHTNVESAGNAATHSAISGSLKPGQEIDAYTVIHVPAKGGIATVILNPAPVGLKPLRFDLTSAVAKLPAPYAAPADPTGLSALEVVPGQLGTPYSVGDYDLTLDKMEYTDQPQPSDLGAIAPDEGKHFAVFTLTAKCFLPEGGTLDAFTFNASLLNDLGEPYDRARAPLLDAGQDTALSPEIQFGQEKHFRIYYPVPKPDTLKSLTIQDSALGRKFAFDLSPLKRQ